MALLADGRRMKASDLATGLEATPAFVPQVIGPLVNAGWVRSDPGPTGGYAMVVPPAGITALDVVEAVDGPTDAGRCVVADRPCGHDSVCALHIAWARARSELMASLRTIAVSDVAADVTRAVAG
jgi:Rrf2 family protein